MSGACRARLARSAGWPWLLLAVCSAAIPFLHGISGSRVFYIRDLSKFFWGRYLWLRHELWSGTFPLWDPYVGGGQSAVADALHQLFLPPALVVRLIGSEVLGFNLWVATPFPLAALGAWLFFRRRFAADAAAVGAIAFALSGPIVSTGNFPNLSWSAAAIPWVLWAVDRVIAAPGPRPIGVLAVMTGLQAVAGEPVTLLATLLLSVSFAFVVAFSIVAPLLWRARALVAAGLGMTLGLCLAAIQLVPLGRAAAMSERAASITKDFWSLHPLALAEMVAVHLFGNYYTSQSLADAPWLPILNSGREPFLFSLYFGIPLLGLASYGLISRRASRETIFWAAAGAASLLGAFGGYTPVYPFLRDHLPLLPSLRFPAKYLVIWSIVVAACAAAGWEALAGSKDNTTPTPRPAVVIGLPLTMGLLAAAVAAASLYLPHWSLARFFALARSLDAPNPVEAAVYLLRTLPHAASSLMLLSLASAVLLFLSVGRGRRNALARMLLLALVVADLQINAWGVNPTFDPTHVAEPLWLKTTHAQPESRVYVGGKTDGTLSTSDLDSSPGYLRASGTSGSESRAVLSGQVDFYPSGWRAREMLSYDLAVLWPREFAVASKQFFLSGRLARDLFLDRTGVRYRTLPRPHAGGRTPLAAMPYLLDSFLFDYGAAAASRVTIVSKVEVVRDVEEQIERLFTAGWDARSSAIVEHEPDAAGVPGSPAPPSASITADESNRVAVQSRVGSTGGYVVLLDSFAEGWHATVDGRPAAIVRANGLFRGVRLVPGSHIVEFRYRPRTFLLGAAISGATLTGVLGLIAWPATLPGWCSVRRRRDPA